MAKAALSIRTRLMRVVVLTILGAIVTSVTFFAVNEFRRAIVAEQARMKGSAAAFAAAAATGAEAGDRRAVLLVLRGIKELPQVRYAAALDSKGLILAEIGQVVQLVGRDGSVENAGWLQMLSAETLTVSVDIRDSGEVIGSLVLVTDITNLRAQYLTGLLVSLAASLLLIIVTAFIARAQISRVIQPLGTLADDFADIGRRSDLKRRLMKERSDEVGVLVDAFNEMFSQIERRDGLLQKHRETLEQTVEERTSLLRLAKEEAERANAAKSNFLATMSHEIRTPMNGMMVMAEMLSASALSPKHLRYADVITRSGRALLSIINDILDYSKIEAGKLNFETIPFSLDTLIEDTASLFSERAREKGLTLATFVAPDMPTELIGDPTRLGQVLGNLVNNALKFTENGGVTVEAICAGSGAGSESTTLEIHVRDTGIGIPADKLATVFERFSQADQTITRKFGGTGLGLSISRQLVEGMGGDLQVNSRESQGSDFCLRLTVPVAVKATLKASLNGKRIAVLTANRLIFETVARALESRGAIVTDFRAEIALIDGTHGAMLPIPYIFMRPFAEKGASSADANLLAEVSAPIRRADFDAIAKALATADWTHFNDREREAQLRPVLPNMQAPSRSCRRRHSRQSGSIGRGSRRVRDHAGTCRERTRGTRPSSVAAV